MSPEGFSSMRRLIGGATLVVMALAAGCSSVPAEPAAPVHLPEAAPVVEVPPAPVAQPAAPAAPVVPPKVARPVRPKPVPRVSRGGAYYMDDGPGDNPPDMAAIPDAVPRAEPLHPIANRPYTVFGKGYVPKLDAAPLRERGHASWYGRKFHGRKTSSGERYDMYGMTAAHPTAPIPSYMKVINVRNGRTVVVRVNDRGPFLNRRVIDLTYTAAYKLGFADAGSAEVDVEMLTPMGPPVRPMQTAVRADMAAHDADAVVRITPMAVPMLADAAAERLALETVVDDVVVRGEASATWLQFGAFASRDNAEAARTRMQRDLPWFAAPVELVQHGELWRVQAGPWTRRDDAAAVAERVGAASAFRPIPVLR
ncbi:MAG: septal ring lytic transglycosylase RlpA family protein [Burkholderiales bacterium]